MKSLPGGETLRPSYENPRPRRQHRPDIVYRRLSRNLRSGSILDVQVTLRGLCLSAASKLGQFGIRVGVSTPMFLASWSSEAMHKMLASAPLGRWAEVDDMVALVAFL